MTSPKLILKLLFLLNFLHQYCCQNAYNQTGIGGNRAGIWIPVSGVTVSRPSTSPTVCQSSCQSENCCFWECPNQSACQVVGGQAPTCQTSATTQVFAQQCIQPQCITGCSGLSCQGITRMCGTSGDLLCAINI